jgi:hypothetical protein
MAIEAEYYSTCSCRVVCAFCFIQANFQNSQLWKHNRSRLFIVLCRFTNIITLIKYFKASRTNCVVIKMPVVYSKQKRVYEVLWKVLFWDLLVILKWINVEQYFHTVTHT